MTIVVRSSGDAALMTSAVRDAVRSVDPTIPAVRHLDHAAIRCLELDPRAAAERVDDQRVRADGARACDGRRVRADRVLGGRAATRDRDSTGAGGAGQDVRRLVVGQGVRLTLQRAWRLVWSGAIFVGRGIRSMLFGVNDRACADAVRGGGILLTVAVIGELGSGSTGRAGPTCWAHSGESRTRRRNCGVHSSAACHRARLPQARPRC